MRTLSSTDTALLTHPTQGVQVWIKVEMTRTSSPLWGAETWVDLTDLAGHDWVLGVNYGEDIDTPAADCTIKLLRRIGTYNNMNLSPFMTSSVPNQGGVLIKPYRKVRVSVASCAMGTPRSSATFNVVFRGRVDSYAISDNDITVKCRNQVGELQDAFILKERGYGSYTPATATNNDLEDLIQDVLDDNYNTTSPIGGSAGAPYTLYSRNGTAATPWNSGSDATNWSMLFWTQQKMSVWQAIQAMAQNIGYQLRIRYHEGSGIDDFVLVLEEPERSTTTADLTLDPKLGQVSIDSIGISNETIRNFWRVSYAKSGAEFDSYEAEDTTSQTNYGYRPAELQHGSSSIISESSEVVALANALLADTKDPTMDVTATLGYAWYLQLNDLIALEPDDETFDAQQKLAVYSIRHSLEQGGRAMTALGLSGKPKFAHVAIREKQRWYGKKPNAPTMVQTSINYSGLVSNGNFGDLSNE